MSRLHENRNEKIQKYPKEEKFFYSNLEIKVNPKIYYPREDSILILDTLSKLNLASKKILDMGTGSGILACFCAKKGGQIDAADINSKSLQNAKINAKFNHLTINFILSDLFQNIKEKYDIIIFNPPYLPGKYEFQDNEELTWNSGPQNQTIVKFLIQAKKHLKNNGELYLVVSSLTKIQWEKLENNYNFKRETIRTKKVPWEKLTIERITYLE